MELTTKNYHSMFFDIRVDETFTSITSKKEARDLIENLTEVITELNDFITNQTKNKL